MINQTFLPEPYSLSIESRLFIGLNAILSIHNKALEYGYSDIHYGLKISKIQYTCNTVEEISEILKTNSVDVLNNLNASFRDSQGRLTEVNFAEGYKNSCVIRQSEVTVESKQFADDVGRILNSQNHFFLKNVTKILSKVRIAVWLLLIALLTLFSFRYFMPENIEKIFLFFFYMTLFLVLLLELREHFTFTVCIYGRDKKISFWEKYTVADKFLGAVIILIVGIVGNYLFSFIVETFSPK